MREEVGEPGDKLRGPGLNLDLACGDGVGATLGRVLDKPMLLSVLIGCHPDSKVQSSPANHRGLYKRHLTAQALSTIPAGLTGAKGTPRTGRS